jgi:hypothetical protein
VGRVAVKAYTCVLLVLVMCLRCCADLPVIWFASRISWHRKAPRTGETSEHHVGMIKYSAAQCAISCKKQAL